MSVGGFEQFGPEWSVCLSVCLCVSARPPRAVRTAPLRDTRLSVCRLAQSCAQVWYKQRLVSVNHANNRVDVTVTPNYIAQGDMCPLRKHYLQLWNCTINIYTVIGRCQGAGRDYVQGCSDCCITGIHPTFQRNTALFVTETVTWWTHQWHNT